MRIRMVGIDIDGTLLRDDGTIGPEDLAAVARATAAGLTVTLATGRVAGFALPVAREIALTAPIVCGDGTVIVHPQTGSVLHSVPLGRPGLELLFARGQRSALFLFTPDTVIGRFEPGDRRYVQGWTPRIEARHDLVAWLDEPARPPVFMAVALASADETQAMIAALEPALLGSAVDLAHFPIADRWALRLMPAGVSKATGLAQVASTLGITAAEVAVIGDWYNDLPMFRWAGRSYAMGHAPPDVVQAACHVVRATAATGGGIAELVDDVLAHNDSAPTGPHA